MIFVKKKKTKNVRYPKYILANAKLHACILQPSHMNSK